MFTANPFALARIILEQKHPFAHFSLHAGLGPAVQLTRITYSDVLDSGPAWGFEVVAGGSMPWGPGALVGELGVAPSFSLGNFQVNTYDSTLSRVRTGGVSLTVGYRISL